MRSYIGAFFRLEAAGGIVLTLAAAIAIILANSSLETLYRGMILTHLTIHVGSIKVALSLLEVINEGLMPIFFLFVGLEIKRELVEGELSSRATAVLPVIAAIGGMLVPALIYLEINAGDGIGMRGWAIPSATDIAFAVGVLSLLGRRIPESLKVFLLALAIIDDLGAIMIIAVFYAGDLSILSLDLAALALAGLVGMNALGVRRLAPYLVVGVGLWLCVLNSGVHATLAGVALAFAIPLRGESNFDQAPLPWLEKVLHPWVGYAILPLFGFANAGVSLESITWAGLFQPVPLGIALGLFLGKQLGVAMFGFLAIQTGFARLPVRATWGQFYGTAVVTGIGFTMSLFIGTLAFDDEFYMTGVKIGVLAGSLLSAVCGLVLLSVSAGKRER